MAPHDHTTRNDDAKHGAAPTKEWPCEFRCQKAGCMEKCMLYTNHDTPIPGKGQIGHLCVNHMNSADD